MTSDMTSEHEDEPDDLPEDEQVDSEEDEQIRLELLPCWYLMADAHNWVLALERPTGRMNARTGKEVITRKKSYYGTIGQLVTALVNKATREEWDTDIRSLQDLQDFQLRLWQHIDDTIRSYVEETGTDLPTPDDDT